MKKLITYVLFGSDPKYWVNVPYMLTAADTIYSDFCLRYYIHEDCPKDKIQMMQRAENRFPKVEVEMIHKSYERTELTNWRMKPLWESDVKVFLCRDIDYAINEPERKSVEYFLKHSKCSIHGIRSYRLHTVPIMAGLCGFRVGSVHSQIEKEAASFEDYLNWGLEHVEKCRNHWEWGCDQSLPKDFFRKCGMLERMLDCPQFTAPDYIHNFNPNKMMKYEEYSHQEIENCDMKVLEFSNEMNKRDVRWPKMQYGFTGQPQMITTEETKEIIRLANSDMGRFVSDYV